MRDTLDTLYAGATLTRDDAAQLMAQVLDGAFPDAQVAAVLSCYRMRLPTAAELSGFRESLLERANLIDLDAPDALDMVGTGGDRKDTFNITTISALTTAACGVRVVKHGNGSSSSKHGSSDTLRAAGFTFRQNRSELQAQLDAANITFLHAPLFHPSLGGVGPIRRSLGVATVFNLLGPLVNPARPPRNYIGVADARTQSIYADVFEAVSDEYCIVHSMDDYDETTLTGPVRCFTSQGRVTLQPKDFDLPPTSAEAITVDHDATAQFFRILSGKGTTAETDTVAANVALALRTGHAKSASLPDLAAEAKEVLLSGKALSNFKALCAV